MKVILNLENYTVEYLDTTPFIQGTDARNKIEVLVPQETFTNIMIAYTLASGRSTIAMPNKSMSAETYNGVAYSNVLFSLPTAVTRLEGNIMATIVITLDDTAHSKHKFNILNTILNSSDFETFEDAVEGTAEQVLQAIEDMNTNLDTIGDDLNAHKSNTSNPHNVTKAQVGLDKVNNTSDKDKPISDATQAALDHLQDEIDDLGIIAEMPDKIVDVANCFDFTNDESSVDVDNADIDNVNADNVSADEVKTPKIGYSKNNNKNTIEFGDGYGLNHITFKTTDGTYANAITIQDIVNIAQGKTSNYVIDDTVTGSQIVNSSFNSSNASIVINISANEESFNRIKDVNNKSIYFYDLKIGDIVSVTQNDVPDRWVGAITSTTVTFYALESKLNIDSTPTQNSVNPVASGGVYNALLGKVDKSEIGFFMYDGDQLPVWLISSDAETISAITNEINKKYCIIVLYFTIGSDTEYEVYYKDFYLVQESLPDTFIYKFIANSGVSQAVLNLELDTYNTQLKMHRQVNFFENQANKTTAISSSSTDSQYPSAKAVYDFTQPKVDKSNYHLGSFDSVSGNVITRQTGYVNGKDLMESGIFTNAVGNPYIGTTITVNSVDNIVGNCDKVGAGSWWNTTFSQVTVTYDSNSNTMIIVLPNGATDTRALQDIVIQYKLETPYTETIIENEPLNTLDQKGSEWLRDEWEKGLNLIDFNKKYYYQGNAVGLSLENCEVGKTYTFTTNTTVAEVKISYDWAGVEDVTTNTNTLTFTMTNDMVGHGIFVIYGGANITLNANYDYMLVEGTHAYPYQAYNGAIVHEKDITPVLLWENASPNSAFAGQQITTLDMSKYKYIIFEVKPFASDSGKGMFIKVEKVIGLSVWLTYALDSNYYRQATFDSSTVITLSGGYENGTTNNNACIPTAIYGTNVL